MNLTSVANTDLSLLDEQIDSAMEVLTEKQRKFVLNLAKSGNQAQAVLEAGYSPNCYRVQACENLTKPNVFRALKLIRYREQLRSGIDIAYKRAKLIEILNRALQITPVLDKDGKEIGCFQYDAQTAVKAIDMLNRMDGHYTEKLEINVCLETEIRQARERLGISV